MSITNSSVDAAVPVKRCFHSYWFFRIIKNFFLQNK